MAIPRRIGTVWRKVGARWTNALAGVAGFTVRVKFPAVGASRDLSARVAQRRRAFAVLRFLGDLQSFASQMYRCGSAHTQ